MGGLGRGGGGLADLEHAVATTKAMASNKRSNFIQADGAILAKVGNN
jgi:hypothetical protein